MMACSGTFSFRSNPSGRLTADKRQNFILPKFADRRTSFIRKTLYEIALHPPEKGNI
jgi:hypothetical protein